MGATIDNAVGAYSGFAGTDVDEMSFDYLFSIYTAISAPTLSVSTLPDAIIYACALCPMAMYNNGTNRNKIVTIPGGRAIWPTPIFSIADCFQQYRGGFRFRVKMSKTKFHTGRLVVGFVPHFPRNGALNYYPSNVGDMQFKSVIWDLREGNVLDFDCPFISPTAYLDTNTAYGSFFISVLEPLVGPDTVSTTCPMVVEVSGCEDFELAVPVTAKYCVAPLATQFYAQSGDFQPTAVCTSNNDALHCVGERLSSVKQLLNRANFFQTLNGNTSTFINDKFIYPTWTPSSAAPTGLSNVDLSYMGRFRTAFALARGGYVVDIVPIKPDVFVSAISFMNGTSNLMMPAITESTTAVHVKMPFYGRRSRIFSGGDIGGNANAIRVSATANNSTTAAIVYRRTADDFQLGYFFGFAPLALLLPTIPDNAVLYDAALKTRS